ncbi:MAG: hypothetical protein ACR2LX_13380 [Jatrophihabitans sp.]
MLVASAGEPTHAKMAIWKRLDSSEVGLLREEKMSGFANSVSLVPAAK